MEFKLLAESESERIISHFESRYSVPREFFSEKSFLRNKNFVWLCDSSCLELLESKWEKNSIGLLFLLDEKAFKPTTSGIRFLGNKISANVLELNEEEARQFLFARKFLVEKQRLEKIDSTGYIAVKFRGFVLGSAWAEKEKLSIHPNVSRTKVQDFFEKPRTN
ncbi:MAG: hypothetical protein WC602_02590 [archaeon]